MLIDFIKKELFFQYIVGAIIWLFLFCIIIVFLNKSRSLTKERKFFFLLYYVILSITGIIRIFSEFLPFTPDSLQYIKTADNISNGGGLNLFGAFFYSDIIFFIKMITFNNHYSIIFFNVFIFIIALIQLLDFLPSSKSKYFKIWGLFLLVYPSIHWFIPNILRESIFFLCLVNIYINSMKIFSSNFKYKNILLLFLSFIFCVLLRPQILPMLIIWLVYLFFRKNFILGLIAFTICLSISSSEFFTSEYLSKVSLEYLQAKKIEGASSIPNIAFSELIIPNTLVELITSLPFFVFRFLFSPFPWELSNIKYLFAFFDSLLMVLVFGAIVLKVIFLNSRNSNILIFSFLFIVVFGIFEIAFTGAVRHRMPYVLMLSTFLMVENKFMINKHTYYQSK